MERNRPRRILAATNLLDLSPIVAADRMARETGARLEVCHVLPQEERPGSDPLFPALAEMPLSVETRKEMTREVALERIVEVTGRHDWAFGVHVLSGDPAECILDLAARLGVELIVVAPGSGRWWRHWKGVIHTLLHEGTTPVLVAREKQRTGAILAATDLEDSRFPVLAEGLRLAATEHAHLTAVNVVPIIPATYAGLAQSDFEPALLFRSRDTRARVARACSLFGAMGDEVEVCVETGSPAEEIARLAGELLADVVVVGSRTHHRYIRSVSESVIELAPCSVLAVPLDAPEKAAPLSLME